VSCLVFPNYVVDGRAEDNGAREFDGRAIPTMNDSKVDSSICRYLDWKFEEEKTKKHETTSA
jgi:hypothetical protein